MSGVGTWLAKAVVEHDRLHGSNLQISKVVRGRLVQITKFHTYRTPENPRAQITGLVSDKTHTVSVEFDVDYTDTFESEDTDLERERLTANLREVLVIKSYRWKVGPPQGKVQGLEMPSLKMEILQWDIRHEGTLPTCFENTVEVGFGKDDGSAQKVLRKWYFGESHSDMSEIDKSFEPSQPEAGPSRLTMSSPLNPINQQGPRLPPGVITLADFLEPYLAENGAKKNKLIPDWLFETSAVDQADLDTIGVFGLEFASDNAKLFEVQVPAAGSSPTSPENQVDPFRARSDKGKGKRRAQSASSSPPLPVLSKASAITTSFQTQTPPVPLAQHVMSTQLATQQYNLTQSPLADNEDSESEDEIPVVPLRRPKKPKSRAIFDPLACPQSSGESVAAPQPKDTEAEPDIRQDDEVMVILDDADSEDLSDYEREARQQRKRKRTISPKKERHVRTESEAHPPNLDIPAVQEDESIPASDSIESFSLTKRYPSLGRTAARPTEVDSYIVPSQAAIDHGVHTSNDKDKNGESLNSNESSLPTPPPSDHDHEPPASVKRSIKSQTSEVKPKIEPSTGNEHKRAKSKSSVATLRTEGTGSRSSRTELPAGKSDVPEFSRFLDRSRSRVGGPGPSTAASITIAQSIRKPTYTLDLSVDGLSTEEVEHYTAKVIAARAKQRPT